MVEWREGGYFVHLVHGFVCGQRILQRISRGLQVVSEESKCVGGSRNVRAWQRHVRWSAEPRRWLTRVAEGCDGGESGFSAELAMMGFQGSYSSLEGSG